MGHSGWGSWLASDIKMYKYLVYEMFNSTASFNYDEPALSDLIN